MGDPATAVTVVVAHPGGVDPGLATLEAVAGLTERGWRVIVAVPTSGPLSDGAGRLGASTVLIGSRALRGRTPSILRSARTALMVAVGITAALRSARPDIIYVATTRTPLWVLLGRMSGTPVALRVHDEKRNPSPFLRALRMAQSALATKILVESSQSEAVLLAAMPRLAGRVSVLRDSLPGPGLIAPPRSRIEGPFRLVCAADLSPGGGADVAVEALGLLTETGVDARLELVGDGRATDPRFSDSLVRRIDELALGDRVALRAAGSAAWSHLADADMVLVLSRVGDPFGRTAIRAVLCGRPVAVCTADGLATTTEGFLSAIPVSVDPVEITAVIQRVRSGWSAFRTAAMAMVPIAAQQHSTARFNETIHDELQHAVGRRLVRA